MSQGVKAFISYAHADREAFNMLSASLLPLREQGLLGAWTDLELMPGDVWYNTLMDRIDAAQLIIFLLSPAFLSSRFCTGAELQRALARQEAGLVRVIPIIFEECKWRDTALAQLQVLPIGAKPIAAADDPPIALRGVVAALRELVIAIRPRRPVSPGTDDGELAMFTCADLMRLEDGVKKAIRAIEINVATLPDQAKPLSTVLALDELRQKLSRYETEFRRRCV